MHLVGGLLLMFMVADPTAYQEKIREAKEYFYQDKYEEAESRVLEARAIGPTDPASYELRTTIILFRLKQIAGIGAARQGSDAATRGALKLCAICPEMLRQFERDTAEGIRLARLAVIESPDDEQATFLLAKIALNKLWLNLQVLDRLEGWREYKEARKLLAKVLARNPNHIRSLTASAWINYIVASRNFLVRALLGGGNKKTAFSQVRRAASCIECDFFDRIEAKFSLLDLLRQEKSLAEAAVLAKELSVRFPDNASLLTLIGREGAPRN